MVKNYIPSRKDISSTVLPLIIAHRGASALAPENTLAAFKRAIDDGAEGIEFDVRLTRDGVPVVIHDATLERNGRRKAAYLNSLPPNLPISMSALGSTRDIPIVPTRHTPRKEFRHSRMCWISCRAFAV